MNQKSDEQEANRPQIKMSTSESSHMSNLKHLTAQELKETKFFAGKYLEKLDKQINTLKSKRSGQQERLRWINKYLAAKEEA